MSIRKVSDLETLNVVGAQTQLSDLDDSLLEVSYPVHENDGHSFKSMKVRYGDVKTQIISSALCGEAVNFTQPVSVLCGLTVKGDTIINQNDPKWAEYTFGVKAGDIGLSADQSLRLASNQNIALSAKAVTVNADSLAVKGFSDQSNNVISMTGSKVNVQKLTEFSYAPYIPTVTDASNVKSAVNIEYLTSRLNAMQDEIEQLKNSLDVKDQTGFKLVRTEYHDDNDIINVKSFIAKYYQYTYESYDDNGNLTAVKNEDFVEYDIKSSAIKNTSNRTIYFPDILDNDTMSIIATETTNMNTPTDSRVTYTSIKLKPIDSGVLSSCITAAELVGVNIGESANIHIFARITNFDDKVSKLGSGRFLFPYNQSTMYDFKNKFTGSVYTFSTPAFSTGSGTKFMLRVNGKLNLDGANDGSIYMYAVFSDLSVPSSGDDGIVLYSGISGNTYPQHERLKPQRKSDGQVIDLHTGDIKLVNNGYYMYSASSDKYSAKNRTTYSYICRYYYAFTVPSSQRYTVAYNSQLADESGNVLTTKVGKVMSGVDSSLCKSIGSKTIKSVQNGVMQYQATFSLAAKAKNFAKSMRIVFAAGTASNLWKMKITDSFQVQIIKLD